MTGQEAWWPTFPPTEAQIIAAEKAAKKAAKREAKLALGQPVEEIAEEEEVPTGFQFVGDEALGFIYLMEQAR